MERSGQIHLKAGIRSPKLRYYSIKNHLLGLGKVPNHPVHRRADQAYDRPHNPNC